MRIFITGSSSFTGYWFAKTLVEAGHSVVASFTKGGVEDYSDIYRTRMELLLPLVEPVWNASMGSDAMIDRLSKSDFDLLCLHGAVVGNHKAPDFPVMEALRKNTFNLDQVLSTAKASGIKGVIHTGTYFEADEGKGTEPLHAFSPYALSKTLTWHVVRFACYQYGIRLGKFVVANPFGPLEKGGFTQYLLRSWKEGKTPVVQTPDYVRDNVPVDLMSLHYLDFCVEVYHSASPPAFCAPSHYAGPQNNFARLFSAEAEIRLKIPCPVECAEQTDYSEPMNRINIGFPAGQTAFLWNHHEFWNGYLLR